MDNGAGENIRMQLIYYGSHSEQTEAVILSVRPQYLISNSLHSLWGEVTGHQSDILLKDISPFQRAGIKVTGYLTSGYEGRGSGGQLDSRWSRLDTNLGLVRKMAEYDGLDGIFLDECSNYPDEESRRYLRSITTLAHGLGLTVFGNTGMADFDEWFFTEGGFDMVNSTEEWTGQDLTPIQQKWGHRIGVTGFNPQYGAKDADFLIRSAWQKGLACAYISDNEYLELPAWMPDAARLLREG